MDKYLGLNEAVAQIRDGESVVFGGGGLNRKPMAAARAIAASSLTGINVITFLGSVEVDLLLGMGKATSLSFAFVGFDALGLAPNFRAARERGELRAFEYSERMLLTGLEAGAKRLPHLPIRSGLGTDVLTTPTNPFKVYSCPISGEPLVAVPAIIPDVAFLHVNCADRAGNAVIEGDAFADLLMLRSAKRVYLTAERVVEDLRDVPCTPAQSRLSRLWVTGVCAVPHGAGFTTMWPDYPGDLVAASAYQGSCLDRDWLAHYCEEG